MNLKGGREEAHVLQEGLSYKCNLSGTEGLAASMRDASSALRSAQHDGGWPATALHPASLPAGGGSGAPAD